jgi:hypothetical protein
MVALDKYCNADPKTKTDLEIAVTGQTASIGSINLCGAPARQREPWLMAITLRGRVRRSELNHQPEDTANPFNSSRKQVEGSYPAESCPNTGRQ